MVETIRAPEWVMAHDFAEWLRRSQSARGLSGNQLRQAAGVSQSMVSLLLSGARTPSREMAIKIADALATDEESDEDRDTRRNSALLAAGFVPDSGVMSGGLSEAEVLNFIHAYDGNDPRLVAARGTVEATDKALSAFRRARDMSEAEEPPADL